MKPTTIVICSSASFYEHAVNVADQLRTKGYNVVVPKTAQAMADTNDFTVRKSWYENSDDYATRVDYMRSHFDRISEGDAVLVINDEKHSMPGYIGPNVLMEISLAWYQQKPVYLLGRLPENSAFEEELKTMSLIELNDSIENLDLPTTQPVSK